MSPERSVKDVSGSDHCQNGRGGGIRTPDPLLPKQMRYQTALRPDCLLVYRIGSMRSQLAEQAVGARSEHSVKEAVEDPRQQKHGNNDQCGQHNAEAAEKEPAL